MKINFRKPKYVIPALVLLPILWLGWNVIGMFDFTVEEEKVVRIEGEVNSDIPDPNLEQLAMKSKYQNMIEDFGRIKDHAAVQVLNDEEENPDLLSESLYSDKEIAKLDSMNEANNQKMAQLEALQKQVDEQMRNEPSNNNQEQQTADDKTNELMAQVELLQRLASGEEIKTPEQLAKEEEERKRKEEEQRLREEIAKENAPKQVVKADAINKEHFNTVGKKADESTLIKAMLDENIKVVDGSRIRIRLMDDVVLNETVLRKGTYLYATITGFGAQRVRASVKSILVDDELINVSLDLFDNDGMEGFYVPASTFRDLAKEAAGSALGQNININSSSSEQNLETFAFQTLQNVYQSATTAISGNIKKNKAKLKYNTVVYLINDKK